MKTKEEKAIYDKKRYLNNRDRLLTQSSNYWQKHKDKKKEYDKMYRKKNTIRLSIQSKEYKIKNNNEIKEKNRQYYKKNKEKILKQSKEWYQGNKIKRRKYRRGCYHNNIDFKLRIGLSSRILRALLGKTKYDSTMGLVGCSIEELKKWIESQFAEGMTWYNHGKWHIDHIYPCSEFNLEQPYEQKICFNWFNLQPLWANENFSKGSRVNIFNEDYDKDATTQFTKR